MAEIVKKLDKEAEEKWREVLKRVKITSMNMMLPVPATVTNN